MSNRTLKSVATTAMLLTFLTSCIRPWGTYFVDLLSGSCNGVPVTISTDRKKAIVRTGECELRFSAFDTSGFLISLRSRDCSTTPVLTKLYVANWDEYVILNDRHERLTLPLEIHDRPKQLLVRSGTPPPVAVEFRLEVFVGGKQYDIRLRGCRGNRFSNLPDVEGL